MFLWSEEQVWLTAALEHRDVSASPVIFQNPQNSSHWKSVHMSLLIIPFNFDCVFCSRPFREMLQSFNKRIRRINLKANTVLTSNRFHPCKSTIPSEGHNQYRDLCANTWPMGMDECMVFVSIKIFKNVLSLSDPIATYNRKYKDIKYLLQKANRNISIF